MTPEQYARTQELFHELFELPAGERTPQLERRANGDSVVRAEVEDLLREHDAITTFLEHGATTPSNLAPQDAEPEVQPGQQFGPYTVVRRLGEGGFGTVCEAEQIEPVRRHVALKILKRGMDSRQVIARFEIERRTLALMEHPYIAKVLDAGTTPDGRPYFVMEYVDGVPITDYADAHDAPIADRLKLFVKVCEAIQHAHQKGIIHRDIKPTNVLVFTHGERATPKVIDFGIAKATGADGSDRTHLTGQCQLIGTPAYMSPEQADFGEVDIDTRSDVYSLGALLYELLVGVPPFDPTRQRRQGFAEVQRILREQEPDRPSTRIDADSKRGRVVARHRATRPAALRRDLRGDLDWITLKTLEKDRARRYPTALELAADVQRHLDHQPVVAGPPSQAYRLRKFVRRNRAGVAAAVLVGLTLALGLAGTIWQRNRAADQAAVTASVLRFLGDVFVSRTTGGTAGDVLTVGELDRIVAQLDSEQLFTDPDVRARIQGLLAFYYSMLGRHDEAEQRLVQSLRTRTEIFGAADPQTLMTRNRLARTLLEQGRAGDAEVVARTALTTSLEAFGPESVITLSAKSYLATALKDGGKLEEAEPLLIEVLDAQRRHRGEGGPDSLRTLRAFAELRVAQRRWRDAEKLFERAVELVVLVHGESHRDAVELRTQLAKVRQAADKL